MADDTCYGSTVLKPSKTCDITIVSIIWSRIFLLIYLKLLSLSRIYKKHYIVVIKKARERGCRGGAILPVSQL
jgi:hypothetical protein